LHGSPASVGIENCRRYRWTDHLARMQNTRNEKKSWRNFLENDKTDDREGDVRITLK
jgi:hypothetical protein